MTRPLDLNTNNLTKYHEKPYKVFNQQCLLQCPTNYMDDYENHTCKPCKGIKQFIYHSLLLYIKFSSLSRRWM